MVGSTNLGSYDEGTFACACGCRLFIEAHRLMANGCIAQRVSDEDRYAACVACLAVYRWFGSQGWWLVVSPALHDRDHDQRGRTARNMTHTRLQLNTTLSTR